MNSFINGGSFLLQFTIDIILLILMLRFLMRYTNVDWNHTIVSFIAKITNPICRPLNRFIKPSNRWDWNALISAWIIEMIFIVLISIVADKTFNFIPILSIILVFNQLIDLIFWLIVIQAVLSWVIPGYNPNTIIIKKMVEPILRPFQKVIPTFNGLDLSPILAILLIQLTQIMLIRPLVQNMTMAV